jgi:hypothetical protein
VGSTGWRKSSYSGPNDNCVEVALGSVVGVRDTKVRQAGQLTVSTPAWRSVLDRLAQDSGSHR